MVSNTTCSKVLRPISLEQNGSNTTRSKAVSVSYMPANVQHSSPITEEHVNTDVHTIISLTLTLSEKLSLTVQFYR